MVVELEGCQWRRSSQVELFELGFWFWLCELGWGLGKGARLAGLARVGVGGGGSHHSHQSHHQVAATCGKPLAEAPKGALVKGVAPRETAVPEVHAKWVPTAKESAVQDVEKEKVKVKVKEPEPAPEPEPEAVADEEPESDDVEELLAQHQELVDSMLAEVMVGIRVCGNGALDVVFFFFFFGGDGLGLV